METLIHFVAVIALIAIAFSVAIGIIAFFAYIGGRQADEQLNPENPINYGRRSADYPSPSCARRREDSVRATYLAECE